MTRIKIKGFKIFEDRHGKLRCYHRKTGIPIDLAKYPLGTVGFIAECQRINERIETKSREMKAGTLGKLILTYRQSYEFDSLAKTTRRGYESTFRYLQPFWDIPLQDMQRPYVIRMRDKAYKKNGRGRANYLLATLSMLFNWAINHGLADHNPAQGIKKIKRPRDLPDANRPWTDAERIAVLEAAPWKLKVAIALCMYSGLREGDALRLRKDQYDGSIISIKTAKAGKEVICVVPDVLHLLLKKAPPHFAETLAANSRGKSWTEDGFRTEWMKLRYRLEQEGKIEKGLTIHGLRHTVGKTLKELGYENKEIALALGHTEAMAAHYSKKADLTNLSHKMTAAFNNVEKEKVSNLLQKVSNLTE